MWAQTLEIYAIDVEGGKATLFVSPSGESMLVDTGYDAPNGRDAERILKVAALAGVRQLDYLVITHYHKDHIGGVARLSKRLPIRTFVDHGKNFETVKDVAALYAAYVSARQKGKHLEVRAGEVIPIRGMRVDVVTAAGRVIGSPLAGAGAPNPTCASYHPLKPDDGENAHSIGLVIAYGAFRVADLGDLYWNQEHDLACPDNKMGTVDLYLTTHHGTKTSGSPQLVWALRPKVALMNNGATKGGSVEALETIHRSPGLLDLWQLHYSNAGGPSRNTPEQLIANPSENCEGNWLRVSARQDGSFTIYNSRNRYEKSYRR